MSKQKSGSTIQWNTALGINGSHHDYFTCAFITTLTFILTQLLNAPDINMIKISIVLLSTLVNGTRQQEINLFRSVHMIHNCLHSTHAVYINLISCIKYQRQKYHFHAYITMITQRYNTIAKLE